MSDLVEWLTRILDEDARAAKRSGGSITEMQNDNYGQLLVPSSWVLADIAAKRAIIEDYEDHVKTYRDEPTPAGEGIRFGLLLALARIAEGYADRPGYDEAWKP